MCLAWKMFQQPEACISRQAYILDKVEIRANCCCEIYTAKTKASIW